MELGRSLRDIFGGQPGWLAERVPAGQEFDLRTGRSTGPGGTFLRSAASKKWVPAS